MPPIEDEERLRRWRLVLGEPAGAPLGVSLDAEGLGMDAVLEALNAGGRWLLDAAMAPLAATATGPLLDAPVEQAQPPRARKIWHRAPVFGSDTASVLEGVA